MYKKLILGGPGAGKTTRLLNILDEQFHKGREPQEVAFVSFTRKAVNEARVRSAKKFSFNPEDMLYFRTIHSMGFKEMGLRRDKVFNKEHLEKVSELTGMKISNRADLSNPFQQNEGDKALFIDNFSRSTGQDYKEVWRYLGEYIPYFKMKLFIDTVKKYKHTFGLLDFTDMLELYIKEGEPLPVRIAIIDEAQDLNKLQWSVVEKAFKNADEIYIAGDDDQAIYKWSGADVKHFLNLKVDEREVLPKSYRMGRNIFDYANSIIHSVRSRYNKQWTCADHDSGVQFTRSLTGLDFSKGTWYLLARNKYLLESYKEELYKKGLPFSFLGESSINQDDIKAILSYESIRKGESVSGENFRLVLDRLGRASKGIKDKSEYSLQHLNLKDPKIWHDQFTGMSLRRRMYYLTGLKSGQKLLQKEPNITVDTIHAVKGGQADNVVINTDISVKCWNNLRFDRDDETRVFYVGLTRAKNNLIVLLPKTIRYYPFKA